MIKLTLVPSQFEFDHFDDQHVLVRCLATQNFGVRTSVKLGEAWKGVWRKAVLERFHVALSAGHDDAMPVRGNIRSGRDPIEKAIVT